MMPAAAAAASSSSSAAAAAPSHHPATRRPKRKRRRRPHPTPQHLPLLLLLLAPSSPTHTAAAGSHYPLGVCASNCSISPPPCPGQTCGPLPATACNRFLAPTTDPDSDARPWTYCQPAFPAPCTPDRLGCPRCALMQIALHRCDAAQRCTRNAQAGYVVVRTTEATPAAPPGTTCFTQNHFMLVPTWPCTGVESPDPRCTGREGERYWGYAWDEAVARGFGGGPSSPFAGLPWGLLMNPKNARSQHQAHFRFAPLKTNTTGAQVNANAVTARFLAQPRFSTDIRSPTFTWGERAALFASVFVPVPTDDGPIDGRALANRVRPFKRAAAIARAAMPLTMYGVLVTPFQQPPDGGKAGRRRRGKQEEGEGGGGAVGGLGKNETGVVLTAFFNVRGTVLMDETVADASPGNCQTRCAIFEAAAAGEGQQQEEEEKEEERVGPVDPMSDAGLFGLWD